MDLMLRLAPESSVPLYRQVVEQMRDAIVDGRLMPGARLPSGRELAAVHGIARNTATLAYQQLVSEGYLEGRERSGHYVTVELPHTGLLAVRGAARETAAADRPPVRLSRWAEAIAGLPLPAVDAEALPFDFRPRFPARDAFPADEWRRYLGDALARAGELLAYAGPEGFAPLREAVAAYASRSRATRRLVS